MVQINAAKYTPMNDQLIVNGELRPVASSPFDFRVPKSLGVAILQLPRAPAGKKPGSKTFLVQQMRIIQTYRFVERLMLTVSNPAVQVNNKIPYNAKVGAFQNNSHT